MPITSFQCKVAHTLCKKDKQLFPHLSNVVANPRDYKSRLTRCRALSLNGSLRNELIFEHIPKNAGKAVEAFLGIEFKGHVSMRRQHHFSKPAPRYIVVLRHPIERMQSLYYFFKAGNHMVNYKERQLHFCKIGTGKAYRKGCIPKVSLYDFMANGHSIYEYQYINPWRLRAHGGYEHGDSEPIGTEANFMFEFLRPYAGSTMADVKDFLIDQFALVGDTKQFDTFLHQAALLFGIDQRAANSRITELMHHKVNPTNHGQVEDELTKDEYASVAKRHSKDIELYYWGVQQVDALKSCLADRSP